MYKLGNDSGSLSYRRAKVIEMKAFIKYVAHLIFPKKKKIVEPTSKARERDETVGHLFI